jgi:hypothetical protein
MNKIIISTVMACGLLLLDSPEAAAHEETYSQQRSQHVDRSDSYGHDQYGRQSYNRDGYRDNYRPDYHRAKSTRAKKMPRWLKKDRTFRRWYEHTRLQRNRRLSWNQLFDIYHWEYSYFRYPRH